MDKLPCSDMQTNKNYFALCTAIIRQYNDDLKNIDFYIQELKKKKSNYQITQDDIFYLQNFHTTELYELCRINYIIQVKTKRTIRLFCWQKKIEKIKGVKNVSSI